RRTGSHHYGCRRDDARKRSFCRKLCSVSLEQTTAAERRSALGRRESLVPRSGNGPRFSKGQFFIKRKAISIDEDRDKLGARVRDKCKSQSRLGQLLLGHVQGNFAR